jgi:hypothetical protein
MVDRDAEIERLARDMIATHGAQAARIAAVRLNEMIDLRNVPGRDLWACVVHRIHERQGASPAWVERYTDWRDAVPPPAR